MIRLFILPGIRQLEDHALIYGEDDRFRARLVETSVKLFGAFVLPDTPKNNEDYGRFDWQNGSTAEWNIREGVILLDSDDLVDWDDGEPFPIVHSLPQWPEDLAAHLLTVGVDMKGPNGQLLKCTQAIAMTVECAMRGMHGCKKPDLENASAEIFAATIEGQTRNWKPSSERPPRNKFEAQAAAEALFKKKDG